MGVLDNKNIESFLNHIEALMIANEVDVEYLIQPDFKRNTSYVTFKLSKNHVEYKTGEYSVREIVEADNIEPYIDSISEAFFRLKEGEQCWA